MKRKPREQPTTVVLQAKKVSMSLDDIFTKPIEGDMVRVENGAIHRSVFEAAFRKQREILGKLAHDDEARRKQKSEAGRRGSTLSAEHLEIVRTWWEGQEAPTIADLEVAADNLKLPEMSRSGWAYIIDTRLQLKRKKRQRKNV